MTTRQAKTARRAARRERDRIKITALEEFLKYAASQPFRRRLRFAWRVVLGRLT